MRLASRAAGNADQVTSLAMMLSLERLKLAVRLRRQHITAQSTRSVRICSSHCAAISTSESATRKIDGGVRAVAQALPTYFSPSHGLRYGVQTPELVRNVPDLTAVYVRSLPVEPGRRETRRGYFDPVGTADAPIQPDRIYLRVDEPF